MQRRGNFSSRLFRTSCIIIRRPVSSPAQIVRYASQHTDLHIKVRFKTLTISFWEARDKHVTHRWVKNLKALLPIEI